VQLVTLILHFFWCWIFITKLDMREVGAALATNITYILNMVIQDFWIYKDTALRRSFRMPNNTIFQEIGSYLKIGIPGAMMLCFEWWCFELLAIFSGLMSVEALAAEIIVVNIVTFIFMVPLGCSYAASAFTGYFCATGQIDQAKRYSRLTILFNSIITVVIIIVLGACQKRLASFFTGD
jgi:multidrug resistance protein, MATE family